MVDMHGTPFCGAVAKRTVIAGFRMEFGLARCHAAVVTFFTSLRHALENGPGMAGLAGNFRMGAVKRKAGLPVVIEAAINLDEAVDLLGRNLHAKAKAKHRQANGDEPHRSGHFCQTQIPHIGRAYGWPTPLHSRKKRIFDKGPGNPCSQSNARQSSPSAGIASDLWYAIRADRSLTYALVRIIIRLTRR